MESSLHPGRPDFPQDRVVGVFDSGFGGLTVLRALLPRLPGSHFLYLGDTARLPYGAKSHHTVARYAVESARFLVDRGAQLLVIACNTATALALPEIRAAVPVPVIGVVEPGAQAALAAAKRSQAATPREAAAPSPSQANIPSEAQPPSISQTAIPSEAPAASPPQTVILTLSEAKGKDLGILQREGRRPGSPASLLAGVERHEAAPNILVLATAATVASHAYRDTCATLGLQATEMPCPLLVPLVEEGWTDHHVTREVLRIYLTEALHRGTPEAVVLGCTHYPLIAPAITQTLRDLGCNAPVVDSAEATAEAARAAWDGTSPAAHPSTFECFATDSVEKFARLGSHFLGQPIPHVELLDLGG